MLSHFKGPDPATALPEFQPNTSVLQLLDEALRKNGDAVAMVEGQTGRTASFKALLQQGRSIATALRKEGVTAGDYVILCCDKSIAAFSALIGVIFTGATAILYPIPHVDMVREMTRGFPIKAVFCDPKYLDTLNKSLMQMTSQPQLVVRTDPEDEKFRSLLRTEGEFKIYKVRDVQKHVVMIFFSSGTTGVPKGIQISDVGAQVCGGYLRISPTSFLVHSPFFWMSALLGFMGSVFRKFTVISSNSSDSKENLQLIRKYQVDAWFLGGCGAMTRATNETTVSGQDVPSLEAPVLGGETILSSVVEQFKTTVLRGKGRIITGYGTTEAPVLTFYEGRADEGIFPCGFCGHLNPGAEIKILDEKRNIVPIGCLGEIWGKSPGLTPGYWGQPELNKEVFDEDGFLRNGDVGFFNEEGVLFSRGRVGDLMTFRGTKISPAEVEDVLMSHPAVLDTAVVGKPHPSDTEHTTAYVVKAPGTHVTEDELKEFVENKVEYSMRLRGGIHFLDVLPRSIIGKVTRKTLREL